jgi:hypothetical protein
VGITLRNRLTSTFHAASSRLDTAGPGELAVPLDGGPEERPVVVVERLEATIS